MNQKSIPIDGATISFKNQKWIFQLREGTINVESLITVDFGQWL